MNWNQYSNGQSADSRLRAVFKWSTVMLLLLLWARPVSATHIVGGELNYTYLGNESLYIKIKVYRDSLNAIPYFDDPLMLYVYDSTNAYYGTYYIPIPDIKLIIPEIDDSCFVEPPNVLVDFVIYEDTIFVPGLTPGFTLAYMRCCRNNAILNIQATDFLSGDTVGGDLTGAIYPAVISTDLDNSNPEYNTFPPVAICAEKLLEYDHSATDPDGDSLVYELCTPYTGGNDDFVFGDPILQAPPFQEVLFIPPYSLENVMGGVPLSIDQHTGLLTAVPSTLGRFVIAVCVNEYRDGEFLARHRRDFQFNVVDCSRVFDADFTVSPAPKIDSFDGENYLFCDTTLTKRFQPALMDDIPVFWDFGDGETSNETEPWHTFPDTGVYEVMIVAGPGTQCADTMIKTISVQRHVIGAAMDHTFDPCSFNQAEVQFTDISNASEPIVAWQWDFGDNTTSTDQDPLHIYTAADTFPVSLWIYAANGCCALTEDTVITALLAEIEVPDTIASCDGDSVRLLLDILGDPPGAATFEWSPSAGLDDPSAQQPLALPEGDTRYVVTVTLPNSSGESCVRLDTCVVLVETAVPQVEVTPDAMPCSQEVMLTADAEFPYPLTWSWSSDPEGNDTISVGPSLATVQDELSATYYVKAVSAYCENIIPVEVDKEFLLLKNLSAQKCGDEPLRVSFDVVSPTDDYQLIWTIGDTSFTAGSNFEFSPAAVPDSIEVAGSNAEGCTAGAIVPVGVFGLPLVTAEADPRFAISGQEIALSALADSTNDFTWTPASLVDDAQAQYTNATIFSTTLFEVVVLDENGCTSRDTVTVVVLDVICDSSNVFVPNAFSPNGDGLNDRFRPRGAAIVEIHLAVYDRWGNLVFEGTDIDDGWDGTSGGVRLSSDTYGYILDVLCAGDATYRKAGNVTLIR